MKSWGKAVVLSSGILLGGTTLTLSPIALGYAEAATATVKFSKTTYQTTSKLNLRSGAGTKFKVIMTLPKTANVTSSERSGNWYKVSYSYTAKGKKVTKTGWVSGSYLKEKVPVKAASTSTKFTKTSFQVTAGLNLRSGASTKYKTILTIPKGKTVTSTEKSGSWHKVSYTYSSKGKNVTKTGWVSGSYLKEYNQFISTKTTNFFTKKSAKLHAGPNSKSKAAYTLGAENGFASTQKVVNSIGEEWYRISYKGKNYFVRSSDVSNQSFVSFGEINYKTNKEAIVYSSFGNVYTKLTTIPSGKLISSKQKIGNWYKVSYGGKTGYVFSADVSQFTPPVETAISETESYITVSNQNLYQFADPGSVTVSVIPKDTQVIPSHILSNGWYKVSYGGKTGYLGGDGLKKVIKEEPVAEIPGKEVPDVISIEEESVTGKFSVTSNLNIREKPNATAAILTVIPKDTLISPSHLTTNGWYKVSYNGNVGYVSGSFLKEVPVEEPVKEEAGDSFTEEKLNGQTFLIKANLNIRQMPDALTVILGTIPQSKIVIPSHKTSNNWYKVEYEGKTGYISGSYVEQVKTGDPIYSREGYQFIDLRTEAPVTAAQINNYIASYIQKTGKATVLNNKGQVFIDVGKQYGVNALYLAAHAIHESGYGTSLISLGKYNLFGFGAFDATPYVGAVRFISIDSSIDYIGREMKSTYLNPANWKYKGAYLGFSSKTMNNTRIDSNSEGMNFYYASDENWGKTIAKHMENILPYNKSYYEKANIYTNTPAKPAYPEGSDLFPSGTVAVAKKDIILDSKKGVDDKVKTIKAGTTFSFLEKANDYWVRVRVDGKEYWTNDIRFDVYTSYLSVKNLGRNTASSLNVRSGAGTSHGVIGSYSLNDYVELVLNSNGSIVMNSEKTWYQVKLPNGTNGWVSASYIKIELQ